MTAPPPIGRIGRRGALLLIIASLAMSLPISGTGPTPAQAKDDSGGDGGGDGGGDSGGDGGSEDGGSDDGGDDGSDGGGGDSGSGGSGGGDDGGGDSGGGDDGGGDSGGGSGSDGGSGGSGGSGSGGSTGGSTGSPSASSGASTGSKQSKQARDGALATRLKDRIVPIREIEALVNRIKPGDILDINLYKDRNTYVYRVKVMQRSGAIYDLRIDAVTRKLLSARER